MTFLNSKNILSVLFLGVFSLVFGQKINDVDSLHAKYPKEEKITLLHSKHVKLFFEDNKLSISQKTIDKEILFTDEIAKYNRRSITFSDLANEVTDIHAYSITDKKKSVVDNFEVRKNINDEVFYDDLHEHFFYFDNLKKGSIVQYEYSEKIKDPKYIYPTFIGDYYPVNEFDFTLEYPNNIEIDLKIISDTTGLGIRINKTTSKSKTIYSIHANSLKPFDFYSDAPNIRYYIPHIVFWVKNYTVNSVKTELFEDVNQLYTCNYDFIKNVSTCSDKIKVLADSLTQGISDSNYKIEKILDFCQKNIRYIAIENGLAGYIPRTAEEVLTKKYGDCKDKANLLRWLLKSIGVEAYIAWIGTRDIPYRVSEIPTMLPFNHMIVAAKINNEWKYLDGTAEFYNVNTIPYSIQNKDILISISKDSFLLNQVPILPKENNISGNVLNLDIIKDTLKGTNHMYFTGNFRSKILNHISNVSEKDKVKYIEDFCREGNEKTVAVLKNATGEGLMDDTLAYNFDYLLSKHCHFFEDEIYVNPNLDKYFISDRIDTNERNVAMEMFFPYIIKDTININIPAGYECVYLPINKECNNKNFGFKTNYYVKDNKVTYCFYGYVDSQLISKEMFKEWNKMLDQLIQVYNDAYVFKKKIKK